jgi:hypothetical protein
VACGDDNAQVLYAAPRHRVGAYVLERVKLLELSRDASWRGGDAWSGEVGINVGGGGMISLYRRASFVMRMGGRRLDDGGGTMEVCHCDWTVVCRGCWGV